MDEIPEESLERETPAAERLDVVDVRFRVPGRAGAFDLGPVEARSLDLVVVETERGPELGEVMGSPRARLPSEQGDRLPRVLRKADANDLRRADHNQGQERVGREFFARRARELGLAAKLVRADYRFDGGKATFYFISDGRLDARGLSRDLAQKLHTRVELRQIGPRDESRLVGGVGPCGRELCCSSWLREFGPVSIKMAKEQGLSLNPSKLAGMCGRLKCCLRYEYDTYLSLRRGLPRIGKPVQSVKGDGVVVQHLVLKQHILLQRDEDGVTVECSLEDLVEKRPDSEPSPSDSEQHDA